MTDAAETEFQPGWSRREPLLALDQRTIAAMLAPLFGDRAVASTERLSGGLANTNYRVQMSGRPDPVVLRIYVRDPDACALEVALYRHVRARVPVPEILYADWSGSRYEQPYAVLSWVDGVSLTDGMRADVQAGPLAIGRAAGATLAAIGTYAFPRAGAILPDLSVAPPHAGLMPSFLDHIETCLDTGAVERLGEPLVSEVRTFVKRHAAYLPDEGSPAALLHGDYKAGNLLVRPADGSWSMAGVIDWEFAFAGPPVFDLSILLRQADRLPPDFERGVIAGFTGAGGVLPREWKRTIRLLDFVNLCDLLRRAEPGSAMARDLEGLIVATMRDWDSYR